MTGRDFLPLARSLAAQSTEAEWRTGTGRAYYAAFHVARQFMEDLRFRVPKADRAHKYLAFRLCNSGEPQVSQAGLDLDALRDLRNQADYDLHRPLSQQRALHALQLAERIIVTIDGLTQVAIRANLTNAIRAYERDVLQEVTWYA